MKQTIKHITELELDSLRTLSLTWLLNYNLYCL